MCLNFLVYIFRSKWIIKVFLMYNKISEGTPPSPRAIGPIRGRGGRIRGTKTRESWKPSLEIAKYRKWKSKEKKIIRKCTFIVNIGESLSKAPFPNFPRVQPRRLFLLITSLNTKTYLKECYHMYILLHFFQSNVLVFLGIQTYAPGNLEKCRFYKKLPRNPLWIAFWHLL